MDSGFRILLHGSRQEHEERTRGRNTQFCATPPYLPWWQIDPQPLSPSIPRCSIREGQFARCWGLYRRRSKIISPFTQFMASKLVSALGARECDWQRLELPVYFRQLRQDVASTILNKWANNYKNQWYDNTFDCLLPSYFRGKSKHGAGILNTLYNTGRCAKIWRHISKLGKEVIDREAHRAMEMKYGMKIPKPIDTVYKFWDVVS